MKKQTKGIIFTVIFGGGLLFWATAASMPNFSSNDPSEQVTITGTPADNFPDEQRPQFCETGEARSNQFVKEYKIPTACTQPLAIVTDPDGNVWFAQTNTGKIAKFDPISETFTEFDNPIWREGARSMIWGMDYSPDGSIWYTEETFDSIWKFSTQDGSYQRMTYPSDSDSLPQRLKVVGSQIIVNDFVGNKITFLDAAQVGEEISYLSLPSPVPQSITGDFTIDSEDNIWYTNWIFQGSGVLVKFDKIKYESNTVEEDLPTIANFTETFKLPSDLSTPNGIVAGPDGNIWIVDTSSSYFFSFNPDTEDFTKYITSVPHLSTYGNSSGLIKSPISRPYWTEINDYGHIVFNEQTANRIGIFDIEKQSLVEYLIPSKNPNWADCEFIDDCGLAQIFGFTLDDDKIWFTEWVENNIGVLDTSVTLPFKIQVDLQEITLSKGEQKEIELQVVPQTQNDIQNVLFVTSDTAKFSDLIVESDVSNFKLDFDGPQIIKITITAGESALSGTHKVLIGGQTDDVAISQYLTVNVVS